MAWWRKGLLKGIAARDKAVSAETADDGESTVRGETATVKATMADGAGIDDRDHPREVQRAPIPSPRTGEAEAIDPAERWDMIKQDLQELDPEFFSGMQQLAGDAPDRVSPLTDERLADALRRLGVRYLSDDVGSLIAMWERHVVQVRREGPDGEILVVRARGYATVPADWSERAYSVTNEWNRTRRFLKAYIGEPTELGRLPVYGEMQIPLRPGLSDALLDELIDCGTAIAGSYIDWLHGDGGLL